jgi:hypothetical protein
VGDQHDIHASAFVDPSAQIIGKVRIGKAVYEEELYGFLSNINKHEDYTSGEERKVDMKKKAPVKETNLEGLKLLKQGKVRDIYDFHDDLLIVATDRISAFDVVMKDPIPDKGRILTQISAFWFKSAESLIPNHMISINIQVEIRGSEVFQIATVTIRRKNTNRFLMNYVISEKEKTQIDT